MRRCGATEGPSYIYILPLWFQLIHVCTLPPLTLRSVLLCMSLRPSPSHRNRIPLFILLFLFVSPASVDLATLVTQELDFCDERAGDAGEAHHEAQRRFALRYKAFILEV